MTLSDARRLLAFDHWASAEVLNAAEPLAADVPRAISWVAHVMAAKRIWFARVTGAALPHPVDPALTPREIRHYLQLAHDEWDSYLTAHAEPDLTAVVDYTNIKGEPFRSTLEEILTHVALHGQHHRGQANAAIRAAGGTPPVIDYIHAARSGAI